MGLINFPPAVPAESKLETIFNLQKDLLKNIYIPIEGLPLYPLDLDIKSNQHLMKDFISRGIEELAEAYKEYLELYDMSGINSKVPLDKLVAFHEELADALHFFVEALIYSDIDTGDIRKFYNKILHKFCRISPDSNPSCILEMGKIFFENYLVPRHYSNIKYHREMAINLFNEILPNDLIYDPSVIATLEANKVSSKLINESMTKLLWDITLQFNIARNFLKKKAWRESIEDTNIEAFKESMLMGFTALLNYFFALGLTPEGIYRIYYHKNVILQPRAKQ